MGAQSVRICVAAGFIDDVLRHDCLQTEGGLIE
jgi:hypothetical protein